MKNFTAAFALVCGVLFIYGFLAPNRIQISTRTEKPSKAFYVMVTLPDVTPEHRWVKVFLCAAEIIEDAGVRCIPEGWDASSTKQTRDGQRQYDFPWGRYIPRGTLLISAITADAEWKTLARGQAVVMR
jgi:hypothetical protein